MRASPVFVLVSALAASCAAPSESPELPASQGDEAAVAVADDTAAAPELQPEDAVGAIFGGVGGGIAGAVLGAFVFGPAGGFVGGLAGAATGGWYGSQASADRPPPPPGGPYPPGGHDNGNPGGDR